MYISEQAGAGGHVLKLGGPGIASCLQITVEEVLLEILRKANLVVQEATRKKSDTSSPTRKTVLSRDLKLVLRLLRNRHPLLLGKLWPIEDVPQQAAPKAKAAAKPRARGKARAKAKAG